MVLGVGFTVIKSRLLPSLWARGGGVCDGLAVRGNLIAMTSETFLFGLGLVRAQPTRPVVSTARS